MNYFADDDHYIVVLNKGELLHTELSSFLKQAGVETAWIQGLGGALELEIGYYDLAQKQYNWQQFTGTYEITSIQGNASRDEHNEPLLHLHGTFSDEQCRAYGGHINRLIVGGTCELFVQPVRTSLSRTVDGATGLRLLCSASAVA